MSGGARGCWPAPLRVSLFNGSFSVITVVCMLKDMQHLRRPVERRAPVLVDIIWA